MVADRGFQVLMVLCALSIFGIVLLIASELVVRSNLAWKQFGLQFFYKADIDSYTHLPLYWDPVNGHFSALPFVYGTLVSSLLALADGGSVGDRRGDLPYRDVSQGSAQPTRVSDRTAGRDSQRDLRILGVFVLVPLMRDYLNPWLGKYAGWTGLFTDDNPTGLGF